jgi:hypothetical protein
MKGLRKWSRILHRDIGFFFIGTSIIYGLSGIALNHLKDWNPSYFVENKTFTTDLDLKKSANLKENILKLLDKIDNRENYKQHYFPSENKLKIFLTGNSSVIVDIYSGEVNIEYLKRRPIFYESNYLHYNPNVWWTWFSDAFAFSLILFAVTSFFMVKGKKGPIGRGGIYIIAGIVIPILFMIFT